MRVRIQQIVSEINSIAPSAVSTWDIWLRLGELGFDPENLSPGDVRIFCHHNLEELLRDRGISPSPGFLRRTARRAAGVSPEPEALLMRAAGVRRR